jgi:hypothetical protein
MNADKSSGFRAPMQRPHGRYLRLSAFICGSMFLYSSTALLGLSHA